MKNEIERKNSATAWCESANIICIVLVLEIFKKQLKHVCEKNKAKTDVYSKTIITCMVRVLELSSLILALGDSLSSALYMMLRYLCLYKTTKNLLST